MRKKMGHTAVSTINTTSLRGQKVIQGIAVSTINTTSLRGQKVIQGIAQNWMKQNIGYFIAPSVAMATANVIVLQISDKFAISFREICNFHGKNIHIAKGNSYKPTILPKQPVHQTLT